MIFRLTALCEFLAIHYRERDVPPKAGLGCAHVLVEIR
jgi:hypothetical protein